MNQQKAMKPGTSQECDGQKQKQVVQAVKIVSNGKSEQKFANTDCWDKILDWLPVQNVILLGKTCKAFNWVVGQYFQRKYPALEAFHDGEDIRIKFRNALHFNHYIQRIHCSEALDESLINSCKSLKSLGLFEIDLTKSSITKIQSVLSKVEEISLCCCEIEDHTYDDFLKLCVNLKSLNIDHDYMAECLPQKYPALEHLDFVLSGDCENDELNTFFKLNPHIRSLSVNASAISEIRRSVMDSDIQLNDFTMDNYESLNSSFFDMLNELHQRGFYKRLYFSVYHSPSKDQLTALRGLVTLYIEQNVDLPELPALKELGFPTGLIRLREEGLNISAIPSLCINLRRLIVCETSVDDILPFIRHSPYLNVIAIRELKENALNLSALNKERKKLNGAQKITIYVDENVYLATKWSTTDINLDLVEMQRIDSYEDKQPHNLAKKILY